MMRVLTTEPCRASNSNTQVPTTAISVPTSNESPPFTPKQGQYLAFIYAYTRVLCRPPAEADIQRYFTVTPPTVHQMLVTLERSGLIRRKPGVPRSIELLVSPESLPVLR
jgi:DNA-binding MarR family transcriptional regulator